MDEGSTRIIEIRRHAKRTKPGANLSTEGMARARRASACDQTYVRVITSQLPHAVQTAVAMGHAVDEEDWTMASMGSLVDESINFDAGFAAIQRAIRADRAAALYAELQALQLRHHLTRVEPGESVLVVSHGGVAEAGIIGLLDGIDVSGFGRSLDYCEGVRFEFDQDRVVRLNLLRFNNDDEEYVGRTLAPN